MKTRRKVLLVGMLLILSIIAPLSALGKKPVYRDVYNDFDDWIPGAAQVLPSGIVIAEGTSYQTWTGEGWEGTVIQYVTMTIRTDDHGNSLATGKAIGVFTGIIDGKEGTFTYKLIQIGPGGNNPPKGTTTILQGTGELEGIQGHGVLNFGTQSTEWYIHFEP